MAEIKFACPNCSQHIQCGEAYAGLEIPCPTCQAKMTVPIPAGATAPAPAPAMALRTAAAPPPAPPLAAEPAAAGSPTCPSCGNAVAPRAIMCVKCGTNLRTGQKMNTPGRPGAPRPVAAAPAGPTVWYKTLYPYLGAYFAVLALLYFLGGSSPIMKLLCIVGILVFLLTAKIVVTVFAFKDDGVGKGFLCLCLDIYTIYYVFKQSERPASKLLYGIACVLGLLLRFHILSFDFKESAPQHWRPMTTMVTTLVRSLHSPERVFRKWQGPYTVAAAWLGLFLAAITPPHGTGTTVCWLKQCTGIDCLGCGLTRSLSCGLRGMFVESFGYHPFGLIILALFLFTAVVSLLPSTRQHVAVYMESRPLFFNGLYLAFVVAFVGFGSLRALIEIFQRTATI